MALTIDNLEIQIQTNASKATGGLDALAQSLEKLKSAVGGTSGLVSNLTQLATALKGFSAVGSLKLDSAIGQLTKLGSLVPILGGTQGTQLSNNLRELSSALTTLSTIPKISITSIANGIVKLNDATKSLDATRLAQFSAQMKGIADGLSQLSNIGKNNLSSIVNALKKIPDITKSLDPQTISAFTSAVQQLTTAVTPLAIQMEKIANGFNLLPGYIKRAIKALNQGTGASNKASKSYVGLGTSLSKAAARFWTLYYSASRVIDIFADAFNESNEYIESLNLFKVSMGETADAALDYAESVGKAMGIDVAEWITNQGVFQRMATGFGISADQANIMSQNLTQLAYDMSSFFNTDVQTAMEKLQSGMSGQIKGLKAWGYNLSVAALQETALSLGIEQSVRTMTEAQKAQLRYITLIQKSNGVMGDMAKTIATPANSMRILSAQITQLKRAFGDMVSVIVVRVIPYVQAFVELMTEAARELAGLMGFEIAELPSNNLDMGADVIEGIGDAAEDAEGAVAGLKRQLAGFDELNILSDNAKSVADISDSLYDLGFEMPSYDFTNGLKPKNLEEIKKGFKAILTTVTAIGTTMLAWKVSSTLASLFTQIKSGKLDLSALKLKAGITLMITGLALEFSGAYDLGYEGATLKSVVKTALGAALGVAGSLLAFGTGPVGWAIGIGAALAIGITGFSIGYSKRKLKEDLESRFGDIVLDIREITEMSKHLTSTDLSVELNVFVDEKDTEQELKTQITNSIESLSKYNFRVELGIAVADEEYKSAIDTFVGNALDYVEQKQIVATMAVDVVFGDGETGLRLEDFTSGYYGDTYTELYELGEKLKETVSNGFVDGKWIEDYKQEAIDLQKEIQAILDYIATVEFDAKLTSLKLDTSGMDITAESFTAILEEAQGIIDAQMQDLETIRLEAVKVAKMEYDQNIENGMDEAEAKKIYEDAVAEAQRYFENSKLELNAGTFEFGTDMLGEKFAPEIEKLYNELTKEWDDISKSPNSSSLILDKAVYAQDFGKRKNIKNLLKELEPTTAEMEEIARNARELGETVPKEVAEGLRTVNALNAIRGNEDAMQYLIGDKFSTDKTFIEALATSKNAGKKITDAMAEGFLNNTTIVEDAANGTITLINDSIGEMTLEVTPELVSNMEALGVNLSDGLLEGAKSGMEEKKSSWLDWAIWPWNWFKKENEIHSPSKLFERGGAYIIEGLWNGLSETWDKLTKWWEGLSLPTISFKMPHFEWTSQPAKGTIANILSAIGLPASLPKLNVNWYASGGFPTTGQMFVARERGPELVGRIGNKNAVVNNNQIITGIATAVYNAMMAAHEDGNNGNSGNARIVVQIGDRAVGEAAVRFINGQIVQTGTSPIYN